jgi:hypothetical protein
MRLLVGSGRVARGVVWIAAFAAGCSPRVFAGDPSTTGDEPSLNRSTSAPVENVPYCAGGARASACLLGANCRVTEAGCQVCQCLGPP